MSKYIYVLLLLSCAVNLTNCQAPAPVNKPKPYSKKKLAVKKHEQDAFRVNWSTNHLKGRVKSIWQFTYAGPAADTSTPEYQLKEHFQYDTSGNQLERTIYHAEAFDSRNIYRYDATNKCIEIMNYAEDGSFNYRKYHIFDSSGNIVESGERHKDSAQIGSYSKWESQYDEHGGCVKISKGYDVSVFSNIYDEKDDILTTQKMVYNKVPSGRVNYKYDDAGYLLERESLQENGLLDTKTTRSYNERHQVIKIVNEKLQDAGSTETFSYDTIGNILRYEKLSNQPTPSHIVTLNSYTYDNAGNWTKCSSRDLAGKVITIIRTFSYY